MEEYPDTTAGDINPAYDYGIYLTCNENNRYVRAYDEETRASKMNCEPCGGFPLPNYDHTFPDNYLSDQMPAEEVDTLMSPPIHSFPLEDDAADNNFPGDLSQEKFYTGNIKWPPTDNDTIIMVLIFVILLLMLNNNSRSRDNIRYVYIPSPMGSYDLMND